MTLRKKYGEKGRITEKTGRCMKSGRGMTRSKSRQRERERMIGWNESNNIPRQNNERETETIKVRDTEGVLT